MNTNLPNRKESAHNRRLLKNSLMMVLFAGSCALAEAQSTTAAVVPSNFTSLYQLIQTNVAAFNGMIPNASSSSPASNTLWSSELLSANANQGLQLLTATKLQGIEDELARLKSLGLSAVTVTMGFPILNQDFYTFNGDPQDFATILLIYQEVATAIHKSGMKMIVESAVLFPGFFSSGSGFNLTGYYASFPMTTEGDTAFVAARVKNILTIAQQVGPDYINLNSEPDTDSELSGRTTLYGTPQAYAAMNDSIVTQLHAQGVTTPMGAGIGTWLGGQSGAQDWVQALLGTHIDYFDMHIYPTFANDLPNAITYADMALQANPPKQVAISEAWDYKQSATEQSNVNNAASFYARDAFSFWAPVDSAFIQAFVGFANWKGLIYLSPEWSRYFWAYLNYTQETQSAGATLDMTTSQAGNVLNDATMAASVAIHDNFSTPPTLTGMVYKAAVAAVGGIAVTAVSAANYAAPVAPDSVVSLFAANIATTVTSATAPPPAPLPTSLGGVSATITDSSENTTAISLIAVTKGQVDAVLPAGLQAGPAAINLTTSSGVQVPGSVIVAAVAPSLFSADESGRGTAAAQVATAHSDGSQTVIPYIATCTSSGCTPVPISLGSSTDQVYLELFGTGIRGAGSNVTVTVGGTAATVSYAGAQGGGAPGSFYGLDQVNVLLPHSLAGSGTVNVVLTAAGQTANTVTVDIQ